MNLPLFSRPQARQPLRDYQHRAVRDVLLAYQRARSVCLVAPTGCHAAGQGILMADGSVVPVEDVRVGDALCGLAGRRVVSRLHRGTGEMFRIVPTKGDPFVVNADHVLSLVRVREGATSKKCAARAGEIVDVTVREWLAWSKRQKHIHKLFRVGVRQFEGDTGRQPIPPYILGILLGDGCLARMVEFTTADPEPLAELRAFAAERGLSVVRGADSGASTTWRLTAPYRRSHQTGRIERNSNPLTSELRSMGLCVDGAVKFVPRQYLRGAEFERLDVLAGLLDADGSLTGGGFDFISKSEQLARDVAFLSRSLGLAAYVRTVTKSAHPGHVGTYYRVSISGECSIIPCRIARKRAPKRFQKKVVTRSGFRVEHVGPGEFFGFTVDQDGRYLLDDFTVTHNSGKTRMGEELVHLAVGRSRRVLWLAHRRELVKQAADRLRLSLGHLDVGVVSPGHEYSPGSPVQVATIQTLLARDKRPHADLLVFDECFPAGTLVDGRPIESIRAGDLVWSVDHGTGALGMRRVVHLFRKKAERLVSLSIGGIRISCTPNHPLFVKGKGYVDAASLVPGDLCCVRTAVRPPGGPSAENVLEDVSLRDLLREDGGHQPQVRESADARAEPDAPGRGASEGIGQAGGIGAPAEGAGWQRASANEVRNHGGGGVGLAHAGDRPDRQGSERDGTSDPLQAGRSGPGVDDCRRGGRKQPHVPGETEAGPSEGSVLAWARVESTSSVEPGTGDGTIVYNLEVEGSHTYFANNVLVHNCHHYVSDDWRQLARAYPEARSLGLTATPERGDGRPLGDLFSELVVAAQYSELIAAGHIVPANVLQPGEYLEDGLACDITSAYTHYASGMLAFAFVRSVEEAYAGALSLRQAGWSAAVIEANTPAAEREQTLELFAARKIKVLISVNTLTEGVDVPEAECCILAAKVGHSSGYLQRVGRVLRSSPGKTVATVLDLVGLWKLHGMPDEDRDYSLTGDAGVRRKAATAVSQCLRCGGVSPAHVSVCPMCGFVRPARELAPQHIHDIELTSVGSDLPSFAPDASPEQVYADLRGRQRDEARGLDWVVSSFRRRFGHRPVLDDVTADERVAEWERLRSIAAVAGRRPRWVDEQYQKIFGCPPPVGDLVAQRVAARLGGGSYA
ncbi:MAG: hypothetical protein KF718_33185 [Polyangiaceae bacterium]|nr:hypothetical protein [Polyangiaceae bacterium]